MFGSDLSSLWLASFLKALYRPSLSPGGSLELFTYGGGGGPSAVSQIHLKVSNRISQTQKYQLKIFRRPKNIKNKLSMLDTYSVDDTLD